MANAQESINTIEDAAVNVLTSMEVAEMVGKEHRHLIEDIRRYSKHINAANTEGAQPKIGLVDEGEGKISLSDGGQPKIERADGGGESKIAFSDGGQPKIRLSDFWVESTYTSQQGKTLPCYLVTKKGCEFIAHKMTGQKGTVFTARYINRFHEMEQAVDKKDPEPVIQTMPQPILDFMAEQRKFNQEVIIAIQSKGNTGRRMLPKTSALANVLIRQQHIKQLNDAVQNICDAYGVSTKGVLSGLYECVEDILECSMRDIITNAKAMTGESDMSAFRAICTDDDAFDVAIDLAVSATMPGHPTRTKGWLKGVR